MDKRKVDINKIKKAHTSNKKVDVSKMRNSNPSDKKVDINRIKNANSPDDKKKSAFSDETENKAEKGMSKGKKIAIGVISGLLIVAIGIIGVLSSLDRVNGPGGVISGDQEITKPVDMDGDKQICQYSVRVYENIIIGKVPFVFENSVHNDADLCYSIIYKDTELFNTGYIKPGDAVSWSAEEIEEQGKTYGCNIFVTARHKDTGEELNSFNLRQLIHIDNTLPKTTGNSAYIYAITVDGYSKAEVINGKTFMEYDMAITANHLHPAEEGAALKVGVPETITVKGPNGDVEVFTNGLQYVDRDSQYIYMAGKALIEGATDDNYTMTTEYYVNVYDQHPNAEFGNGNTTAE